MLSLASRSMEPRQIDKNKINIKFYYKVKIPIKHNMNHISYNLITKYISSLIRVVFNN